MHAKSLPNESVNISTLGEPTEQSRNMPIGLCLLRMHTGQHPIFCRRFVTTTKRDAVG